MQKKKRERVLESHWSLFDLLLWPFLFFNWIFWAILAIYVPYCCISSAEVGSFVCLCDRWITPLYKCRCTVGKWRKKLKIAERSSFAFEFSLDLPLKFDYLGTWWIGINSLQVFIHYQKWMSLPCIWLLPTSIYHWAPGEGEVGRRHSYTIHSNLLFTDVTDAI